MASINRCLTLVAALSLVVGISSPGALADEEPPAGTTLQPGEKAPDFERTTFDGKKVSLKPYRGKKPVILYFYPKNETPGCIKEACGFRDFLQGIELPAKKKPMAIIGISGDSADSHRAFAEKHSLPFPLIADTDNSLLEMYKVPFFKGSLHKRVTFIIDKKGVITKVIDDTNVPEVHVKEAVKQVDILNQS